MTSVQRTSTKDLRGTFRHILQFSTSIPADKFPVLADHAHTLSEAYMFASSSLKSESE
jgi:hypothetical protein